MNSTAEALLLPGQTCFNLLLALFDAQPDYFDPTLHMIFSGLIAITFWSGVLRISFALISRMLGFYPRRPF